MDVCRLGWRNLCHNSFLGHGVLEYGTQWTELSAEEVRSPGTQQTALARTVGWEEGAQPGLWNAQNAELPKPRAGHVPLPTVLWEVLHLNIM